MAHRRPRSLEAQAWDLLRRARMELNGRPIGVRASTDDRLGTLNYDHCFVRDFAMCAPAFLLRGEDEIVKSFLLTVIRLQARKRALRAYEPREGLLPASFRPNPHDGGRTLDADYGEESIARVTPVDSVLWWLITLRAYTVATGDGELARRRMCQRGIRRILRLVLTGSFEMFPTLLVPEGSFMIDRRMGVYGHPLEVQALFFMALRAADELLVEGDGLREAVRERLRNLRLHVSQHYWLDRDVLGRLRREGSDQFGEGVMNVYNVFPESIPDWVDEWLPDHGGYLAGNVGPGRIDFRFFAQGNLVAVTAGLVDRDEADRLMELYGARWPDLVGEAPLRIAWPALEGESWTVMTGADTKNGPWQYHNGGSWPCLLWAFGPAAVAAGRTELLERALDAAEARLGEEQWPEYYDGRDVVRPGARARRLQSWSMAGYLYAKACLRDPSSADLYRWEEDVEPEAATPVSRSSPRRPRPAGDT